MTKPLEALVRSFAETHPETAARALERLEGSEAARVLAALPSPVAARVVERLAPHSAGGILTRLTPEETRRLLEAMTARQLVAVLQQVEAERRESMLAALPEESARQIRGLLEYPGDTAGGMMDPQVVSVPIDLSVQEAVSLLRKAPRESLHYLYVTDRERKLQGVLGMRDLLLASPRDPLEPLVRRDVTSVPASLDREEVASVMRQRKFLALPVVDAGGRLLGVVKHDEVIDAVQEEAFEDLQKMVGAGGDERALAPVGQAVRKRLPWLVVNLGTAFLASAVIALFEGAIARVAALAVLMPIVAGQGGNTGAQALAVVIRALALREITPGAGWRIFGKELLTGLVNGLAVAVLTGAAVWVWHGKAALAGVIALAMVVNMTAACLAGAAIPLALHACGRDPAQSSSIFMTTVTDIVGFASFLGFALLFMDKLV